MRPLISVITVTYNAAESLPLTMESIGSQTCTVYEHIIMDGASADGTPELAKKLGTERTRVFSSPDKGIYDAMNKALSTAQGDYVLFINAGDKLPDSETLQHYADSIMEHDYPGILYGQTELIDRTGKILGKRHLSAPKKLKLRSFANGMVVCHQAFMVLKQIAPLFNTGYRFSADYEWCIICLQHSRHNVNLHRVVAHYQSEGMTTENHRKSLLERYKIMRTYYGTVAATLMHIKFLIRFAMRRISGKPVNRQ